MHFLERKEGKLVVILLIIFILILIALALGYYLGTLKYEKQYERLSSEFDRFRSNYEYRLTSIESKVSKIMAFVSERKGETEEQVNRIKLMSLLLKAKGEIISCKLSLANENTDKSFEQIDNAIHTLREALVLAKREEAEEIEKIRLDLATVKGYLESNVKKAQKELDKLWRKIDNLIPRD
ncbi:hypothetical protein NLC29_03395 [Candidatus Aminicenantes bacterium AH-873-B07]|jgi:DNA-binding transcriptional ArsR family regulator|nr:hypothetical protein [Candidatus Aminicenantes bacterium AH-873-B07]